MTHKQINQLQDQTIKKIMKTIKKIESSQNKLTKLFKNEITTNDRDSLQ